MHQHITVLKQEAVRLLELKPDSVVVDATYGAGGHAKEICSQLNERGTYIGIDADKTAFKDSFLEQKQDGPKFHLVNNNFAKITEIVRSLHIEKVDAILADLGWRTDQFTNGGKGFSFLSDEPLLMTYGSTDDYLFSATDIINGWAEEDIANVIYAYGEERYARRIAKAIVRARKLAKIETASALAQIISETVPASNQKHSRISPATKTFQALRIAVNDELKVLETFLTESTPLLSTNGVLAVISFHSLEDRQIKLHFRELAKSGDYEILTKKPIVASNEEVKKNHRARSAKLRAIKKIQATDNKL